jgi:LysM repeat protein
MKCVYLLFVCFLTIHVSAQEKLVIMGKASNQYVVHTVTKETSLQSISNQFGQSVTRLSAYNGLNPAKKLAKGAKIKIPLTQYNLVRTKGDRNSAPVYHAIAKGDNLYRLSKETKVPLATLKQWNGLKKDAVKVGDLLIVGYMVNARVTESAEPEEVQTAKEEPRVMVPVISKPAENPPAVKKEEVTTVIKKETAQPTETQAAVTTPLVQQQATSVISRDAAGYAPKEGDEGFFATLYAQQVNDQNKQFHSGDAATFKTISGWSDRKYYVLMNDVAPETIVRITAPNNRSICAKVLGPLQETKGGSGLMLRMSNSAASVLGITDPRFTVTVTYYE